MPVSLHEFCNRLAASDILPESDVKRIRDEAGPEASAKAFADRLVTRDLITPFQAEAILDGRSETLRLGEYILTEEIGGGGGGRVFKARHALMGRLVVVKVLSPWLKSSSGAVQRFRREIQAASTLSHPNIVTTYDAGESKGVHYLVMEYLEGDTLSTAIQKQGKLPVDDALDVTSQVAEGLVYIHSQSLLHRDIKPSNLLLTKQGTIKILDLGLARLTRDAVTQTELTQPGSAVGTVDYMAPEQAFEGKRVDHRADIYSLGCTLYTMLTGKPVYELDTVLNRMLAHRDAPIPKLLEVRPDAPVWVESLFERMLAKAPSDRPDSAEAISKLIATERRPSAASPVVVPTETPTSEWHLEETRESVVPKPRPSRFVALGVIGCTLLVAALLLLKPRGAQTDTAVASLPEAEPVASAVDGQGGTAATGPARDISSQRAESDYDVAESIRQTGRQVGVEVSMSIIEASRSKPVTIAATDDLPATPFRVQALSVRTPAEPVRSLDDRLVDQILMLSQIINLELERTRIAEPAGAKLLSGLPHLSRLWLTEGEYSPRILEALSTNKRLTNLAFPDSEFSDFDLRHIEHLPLLKLALYNTQVSDKGVQDIVAAFRNLRQLNLSGCSISNAALGEIRSLQDLESLGLNGTQIRDGALDGLSACTHLRHLAVEGTEISDASVPVLKQLRSLQSLHLYDTAISEKGLAELREALPNCTILGGARADADAAELPTPNRDASPRRAEPDKDVTRAIQRFGRQSPLQS